MSLGVAVSSLSPHKSSSSSLSIYVVAHRESDSRGVGQRVVISTER